MKLTFLVVGTFIEFSIDVEPDSPYTKPDRITYQGVEYEAKLFLTNDSEMLFHLYPIQQNKFKIKLDLSNDLNDYLKDTMNKELPILPDDMGIEFVSLSRINNPPTTPHGWNDSYSPGTIQSVTFTPKVLSKDLLQERLAEAIESENYELAAKLRDKMNEL